MLLLWQFYCEEMLHLSGYPAPLLLRANVRDHRMLIIHKREKRNIPSLLVGIWYKSGTPAAKWVNYFKTIDRENLAGTHEYTLTMFVLTKNWELGGSGDFLS
jgi:hypothetical protein